MCCVASLHHIWISWFVSLTCLAVAVFARRQHTYCTFHQSVYPLSTVVRFPSQRPSCGIPCLEYSVFSFSVCLPSTSKDIPLLREAFSWDNAMTVCLSTVLRSRVLRNRLDILATLTNSDWHWHWRKGHHHVFIKTYDKPHMQQNLDYLFNMRLCKVTVNEMASMIR